VGEWLTVDQAAGQLGLSASGFRALASDEGFEVRRRGSRPGVRRADLEACLERARVQPAHIVTGRDPKPRYDLAEPAIPRANVAASGVAQANFLRDELGWTDNDIGQALGLHCSSVYRRRFTGIRPEHVAELRRLAKP
jgi:hypothetical protein